MLLGNHILVTSHDVQTVIFAVEQFLEVVIDGIGVTETMTACACQTNSRLVLITRGGYILNIIGGQTPITLIVVVIVVITELSAEFQVRIYLPTKCTSDIQVLTLLLLVIVILSLDWVIEVAQFLITVGTCRGVEVLQRNGCVDDSIAQTTV